MCMNAARKSLRLTRRRSCTTPFGPTTLDMTLVTRAAGTTMTVATTGMRSLVEPTPCRMTGTPAEAGKGAGETGTNQGPGVPATVVVGRTPRDDQSRQVAAPGHSKLETLSLRGHTLTVLRRERVEANANGHLQRRKDVPRPADSSLQETALAAETVTSIILSLIQGRLQLAGDSMGPSPQGGDPTRSLQAAVANQGTIRHRVL